MSDEVPIHKATEVPGRITSLCEPGWHQLAEQWANVTCRRCLAFRPSGYRAQDETEAGVKRLWALDLRDRWGYRLNDSKLAQIVDFVDARADLNLGDLVEDLALAMFTRDAPLVCEAIDTPAEDEFLRTIVLTVRAPQEESA